MKSILVQLDDPTCEALNQIAPAAKRKRAEFIRNAITRAVREAQYAKIREAYLRQPDSESEADDWSSSEEWKA